MRVFRFILPVVCALALSACSGTFQQDDGKIHPMAAAKTPAQREGVDNRQPLIDKIPEGYTGQNSRGIVLKPPGAMATPPAKGPSSSGLVWHQIDNYEAGNMPSSSEGLTVAGGDRTIVGETRAPMPQGRDYNDAVKVFSLDGDVGMASAGAPSYEYGGAAQQVFFSNGSAAVKKADRKKIHALAKRMKGRGPHLAVTVVGHASHRVSRRVKDPIRKKMINFAMAQKRASAVTHELKIAGLKPAWVKAVSKGDDEPNMNPGSMPQEAADRRAEIYVDEP